MNQHFIRHIHQYVARYSVSASAARGQRAPGLVGAARKYFSDVPLRSFAVTSESRFRRNLNRHTEQLRTELPRGGRSWGMSRKLLNIFLRNALYTGYLCERYHLDGAEDWYEIPLDSIVAERLRKEAEPRELPRWPGVKHLTPETSELYQAVARRTAKRLGVAPVHLDAVWWGGSRAPVA
jgi:hypothetical protein